MAFLKDWIKDSETERLAEKSSAADIDTKLVLLHTLKDNALASAVFPVPLSPFIMIILEFSLPSCKSLDTMAADFCALCWPTRPEPSTSKKPFVAKSTDRFFTWECMSINASICVYCSFQSSAHSCQSFGVE